jgi:translation initiation factor 2B subunit (eIF-2B alpha/beta/delta family)
MQEAATPAADAEELLDHLTQVARALAKARPESGSVTAAAGRLLAATSHTWALSADEVRRLVLEEAQALLDARERAARAIAVQLAPRIENNVVLTHSASATVREAVLRSRPERLLCSACDPEGEGRTFADEFREAGIPVEVVEDGEAAHRARGTRLVLLGADTIYRDGSLLNRCGTRAIAEAAARSRVPVVVAAEGLKVAPFSAPEKPVDPRRTDLTPADLVTEYVTEDGPIAPDDVEALADRTPFLREGYELIRAADGLPTAR